MISRLRRRLVLGCMAVLLAVLVTIVTGLNLMHYHRIISEADDTLALLRENGGDFPRGKRQPMKKPPDGIGAAGENGPDSPEFPYITRFFSASLQDGELVASDTDSIAAVNAESVGKYAFHAFEEGRQRGFTGSYRFLRYEEGKSTRILFLDCGRELEDYKIVLWISIATSIFGYLAVLLLVALLSGRIIRPISESYEKQKRFITNAGHELKTPLTIIDADAGILEMEHGESEWINDIRCQTGRLARLTNELILLARMEEALKLEMLPLPLSDLVTETAASFQAPARTLGRELKLDIQSMLSCTGDARQICQLVSILLDNALKYSSENSCISLMLEKHGKTIRLCVENETEGVAGETLDNMFERFYRGDSARGGAVRGYGIGLSVAQAIVSAHRGKISAASPDGKRMRIWVQLPAER